MIRPMISILLASLFSVGALAQSLTTAAPEETPLNDPSIISRGFRVSLIMPSFEGGVTVTDKYSSDSLTMPIAGHLGLKVGFANLLVGRLGGTLGATFYSLGEHADVTKFEGNIAYGVNEWIFLKLGVNKNIRHGYRSTSGFGSQFGVGLQVNKTLHIDVNYVSMSQMEVLQTSPSVLLASYQQSGFEIGLGTTF